MYSYMFELQNFLTVTVIRRKTLCPIKLDAHKERVEYKIFPHSLRLFHAIFANWDWYAHLLKSNLNANNLPPQSSMSTVLPTVLRPLQNLNDPIQKLPVETLTEIFTMYCGLDSPLTFTVTLNEAGKVHCPAQVIASTCSEWRNIVCSQQRFWSSFHLHFEYITNDGIADLLIEYIFRSGVAKLRLDLEYPDQALGDRPRRGVFDTLSDTSGKWYDVRLDTGPGAFRDMVSRLALRAKPDEGYFPNLVHLKYYDQAIHPDDERENPFHIFNPCPRLRQLTMVSSWDIDPVDCTHLTALYLSRYEGGSILPLLSRCQLLQSVYLLYYDRILFERNSDDRAGPTFTHRHLTNLCLPMVSGYFGRESWEALRLPSLDTLEIGLVDDASEGVSQLLSMLANSSCSLRSLTIGMMPSRVLADFLSITPTLQSLSLNSSYTDRAWTSEPNQMFSPLFPAERKLPKLSTLRVQFLVYCWQDGRAPWEPIAAQLQSVVKVRRRNPGPMFVKVHLGKKEVTMVDLDDIGPFCRPCFTDIRSPVIYSLIFSFL
ncbi:hypothetical protein GYMLUDRAFT_340602 [Collybiopsis luxurians FD-317 M1]|nr:hypothetical protein GYMLUDRAFT_340602 [Collybiopsis luxurians FD-317 M1]